MTPRGLWGELGAYPGSEAVKLLTGRSGTLYLESEAGALLVTLLQGNVSAQLGFDDGASLEAPASSFFFYPHEANDRPRLPPFLSSSPLAALRALPFLGPGQKLKASYLDFRALLVHLRKTGFSGALVLNAADQGGLTLFHKGGLAAAQYRKEGRLQTGEQALRGMYRQCVSESAVAELVVRALEPIMAAALLGFVRENVLTSATPPALKTFSGIEVTKGGYLYYRDGQAYLLVEAEPAGPARLYASLTAAPELALPDRPTGWEKYRYRLTLRGKDALNPMTDLYLSIGSRFGASGRTLLKLLEKSTPTSQLADALALDEEELRGLLEGLEREGIIRGISE